MSIQPDEDELLARARLMELGVSYAPVPVGAPAGEEGHLEHAAPAAEEASAVPAHGRGAPRLPDWWRTERPDLTAEPEELEPVTDQDEAPEEEPGEAASARPGLRERVRTWVEAVEERTGSRPAPEDTPGDTEEDSEDTEAGDDAGEEDTGDAEGDGPKEGGPKEGGPVSKTAPGKRRAVRPRRRPRFAAPGVPHTMKAAKDRRSLVEIIRSTPDHVVWMLYSGSALGVGFWLGWPQWVTDGVTVLVAEHPTLTDGYSWQCYGVAGAALLLDRRARGWVLPLAWAARIPTASLVVGVLMYGDPTPIVERF